MQEDRIHWNVTSLRPASTPVPSEKERRYWAQQAIASARIEGFVPDQAFLDDVELVIQNKMTHEHAVVRCVARGDEAERAINPKFVGTADRLFESLHRFELAQDILLDLIAVSNAEIAEQGKQSSPDEVAIAQNYLLLELYHEEESHLRFQEDAVVERIIATYGSLAKT